MGQEIVLEQWMGIVVGNQNQTIMSKKQFIWKRKAQEQEGTYRFDGQFVITRGVQDALSKIQIHALYFYILALVEQHDGLDYLQVFENRKTGQKLFFIDQINDEMKKEHPPEHNYCTLMLSDEY